MLAVAVGAALMGLPGPLDVQAAPVVQIGTPVTAGNTALTVNAVQNPYTPTGPTLSPLGAGNRFVLFDVTVANIGDGTVEYNPLLFTLKDSQGFEYQPSFSLFSIPRVLSYGQLGAGDLARGFVPFEVPADARGFRLEFRPGLVSSTRLAVDVGQ